MLDTTFAVIGCKLVYGGKTFTIKGAGIKDDQPYAEVEPRDDAVVQTIVKHIRKYMPLPFSLEEIQEDLG